MDLIYRYQITGMYNGSMSRILLNEHYLILNHKYNFEIISKDELITID